MRVDPSISLQKLRSDYRAACDTSNKIIDAIGDAEAPTKRQGTTRNLRGAILVVIQETGRHAGHADIIREQIDGKTGR
jgi:Protein of unknown function (DUF664)